MKVLKRPEIEARISKIPAAELIRSIEEAFKAYSDGSATVPPVGHLGFTSPPGDVHLKYGHIAGNDHYVIKIASSFYDNPKLGISSSNGMMLAFRAKTGEPEAVLQDEGWLTDLRTALAGAVVAKHLAPASVERIGIVGTGIQARMQLQWLKEVVACRNVLVFGRSGEKLNRYKRDMATAGFDVATTQNVDDVSRTCTLIVTTTPATSPLIKADRVRPGTHVTAMGSDTVGKQELEAAVLRKADIVACDSIPQCTHHGEAVHALEKGLIEESKLREIGALIAGRIDRAAPMITVADLTGIATQDIMIASMALRGA